MQDALKDKLSDEEKSTLETTIRDGLQWLEDNTSAEKDDYQSKQREIEAVVNPIMQRAYQSSSSSSQSSGNEGDNQPSAGEEPTVEEVD